MINIWELDSDGKPIESSMDIMDRDDFYDTQIEYFLKHGRPSHCVEVIWLLMVNCSHQIFISERSDDKRHNYGQGDKTVGGHNAVTKARALDAPIAYVALSESLQELNTACLVIPEELYFMVLEQNINFVDNFAMAQKIGFGVFNTKRIMQGYDTPIVIASRAHVYFGVHTGATKPFDKESDGVVRRTLPSLERRLKQYPELFTDDLHFLIRYYRNRLIGFMDRVSEIRKNVPYPDNF